MRTSNIGLIRCFHQVDSLINPNRDTTKIARLGSKLADGQLRYCQLGTGNETAWKLPDTWRHDPTISTCQRQSRGLKAIHPELNRTHFERRRFGKQLILGPTQYSWTGHSIWTCFSLIITERWAKKNPKLTQVGTHLFDARMFQKLVHSCVCELYDFFVAHFLPSSTTKTFTLTVMPRTLESYLIWKRPKLLKMKIVIFCIIVHCVNEFAVKRQR